jgi:hypothetical protein
VRPAFVGGNDLGRAQRAGGEMGAKHEASLDVLVVRNRRVIRTDVGLDWPRDGLEGGRGVGRPVPASCVGALT